MSIPKLNSADATQTIENFLRSYQPRPLTKRERDNQTIDYVWGNGFDVHEGRKKLSRKDVKRSLGL